MTEERPTIELLGDLRAERDLRWKAGDRVEAEDFFERHPRLLIDEDHALEFVYGEVLLREERGESPQVFEYARRFPGLARQLVALFEVHQALEGGLLLEATNADISPERTMDGVVAPWPGACPVIDGYEILGELGRGGMGIVYRARQIGLNRDVALKMILAGDLASPVQLARFQAEAEAVARLQHPNIVQIYEVGKQAGRPYFSLELVEGGSLARRLDGHPQPPGRAAHWCLSLARAVEAAHAKGIVHRDLKPSNILLTREGVLKVTDFGLAKSLGSDSDLTLSASVLGSPSYMAPEQAGGKARSVGPAADIHALGAILYELLTGRPPFRGATVLETLEQVRTIEPIRPGRLTPGLSRDLETICLKCLVKEPAGRYATASDLADDLDRHLNHEPIRARPLGRPARVARWCRRNPALSSASILAALSLIAVGVVLVVYGIEQARAARDLRAALETSRGLSARSTFERGVALCERGEIDRGALWLARSLELAELTGDRELRRVIRANLTGWTGRLHSLRMRLEHPSGLRSIAYSPDGGTIATGGIDGTSRLWDARSGLPLGPPRPHSGAVSILDFSRDGRTLLTAGEDGPAYLRSRETGVSRAVPLGHPGPILAASFRPDGLIVLTAGADGTVRFWGAESGESRGPVLRPHGPIQSAIFSSDGGKVLTASGDEAALWDATSGRLIHSLLHDGPVRTAAIRPDGEMIATGCEDGTVRRWDAVAGRVVGKPLIHDGRIYSIRFSPDGRRFLTASRDWRGRVWDSTTGALIGKPIHHQAPVMSAAFGPDGRFVLSGSVDGTARLSEAATAEPVGTDLAHQGMLTAVAFSPDGRSALTAGSMPAAHVWELRAAAAASPIRLDYESWPNAMAFSGDGRLVALGGEDGTALVYEMPTGRAIGEPLRHAEDVKSLAFGRDGKTLVTGGDDRTIRLWETATGRPIGEPFPHREKIHSLALGPADRLLLTGDRSGMVRLWDVAARRVLAERELYTGPVGVLAFSPDGESFLSGGSDQIARLGRTATLEPIGPPLRHRGRVCAVAFSPDGRVAATGGADKKLGLWDAATGAPIGSPIFDLAPIRSVAFSPDGRLALLGGIDGASRLWDLATRAPLGPPLLHGKGALATAFDRSGARVLIGDEDKVVRSHDVPEPMVGDASRIVGEVEVMSNMEIGADGGVHLLDLEARERRSRRLGAVAGSWIPR